MGPESGILTQAISTVDQEQSELTTEITAFENFRELASHVNPDPTEEIEYSETAQHLRDAYREEIMDGLDYRKVYGDSIEKSLEQELSFSIADRLLSGKPITRRHKRNLLIETSVAIRRRELFITELDQERAALETYHAELTDIESTIEDLPACSPRHQPFEELLDVWSEYRALKQRCETLLQRRQTQIQHSDRNIQMYGESHALNDYLYANLETNYPVLSALTATIELLDSSVTGVETPETVDESRT